MKAWINDTLKSIWADFLKIHKSLTIWLNGIALSLAAGLPMLQDSFPQLQQYISPEMYKQGMMWIIILNIIVRFKTTSALKDK